MRIIPLEHPLDYASQKHHVLAESGFPFIGSVSLYRGLRGFDPDHVTLSAQRHADLESEFRAYLTRGELHYRNERYFPALEDIDEAWRISHMLGKIPQTGAEARAVQRGLEVWQYVILGAHAVEHERAEFARTLFHRAYGMMQELIPAFDAEYLISGNAVASHFADHFRTERTNMENLLHLFATRRKDTLEVIPLPDRPYSLRSQQEIAKLLLDEGNDGELSAYLELQLVERRISDAVQEHLSPSIAKTVTNIIAELLPFHSRNPPAIRFDYDELQVLPCQNSSQPVFAIPAESDALTIFLSPYAVSRGFDALLMDFLLSPEVMLAHRRSEVRAYYPAPVGGHQLFPPA